MATAAPVERAPAGAAWVGAARRDITPPVGIYARQWGAAAHEVAEGIHRPLSATVLAMRQGPDQPPLVLVSMDGVSFFGGPGGLERGDEWFVRGHLIETLGLARERVMINMTHSHATCSISTANADKPGGHLIEPYLRQIREALVEATREALRQTEPAVFTWAHTQCTLAGNRDLPDPNSTGQRVVCGYNPQAPADQTVLVGRVTRQSDGATLATIVNYACHPTTLAWENRLISPDYVGAMRELVEAQTDGAPCLFLQGASGDQGPKEQYTGDLAVADAHGRHLGCAVLTALASMLPPGHELAYERTVESGAPLAVWKKRPFQPNAALDVRLRMVELPVRPMPAAAEVRREMEACTDRTLRERLKRKLTVVETIGPGPTTPMPLWVWRLGDAVFLGQPNEAYAQLQTELRRRHPEQALVVMNLVNASGGVGYVVPRDRYEGPSIYQVWQSPYAAGAYETLAQACEEEITAAVSGC